MLLRNNPNIIKLTSELDTEQNIKYIIHDDINFIDRLRDFEMSLFCIIDKRLTPIEEEYSDIWDRISSSYYAVYAIGDLEYKLLFKGYWVNKEKSDEKMKTIYYRVNKYGKHK